MKEEVLKFISECAGLSVDALKLSDRIEHEVGLSGLDVLTFYEDFFYKFKIINPDEFNIDKYWGGDGCFSFGVFIKSIFSKKIRESLKTYDVTILHLIKVAETKIWVDVWEL